MQKLFFLAVVAFCSISISIALAQDATQDATQGNVDIPARGVEVQEERLVIETRDRNTPAMRGLRHERTLVRRVPAGYGPIVNNTQRAEIWRIQEEYFDLISLLQLRIELLQKERDAKIEGVLTPDQLERFRATRPVR